MNRSTLIFGTVCVTALVSLLGWNYVRDNKVPNFTRTAEIYVYPETSPRRVIDALGRKAGTKSRRSLERAFKSKKVAEYMKPGHYTVSPSNSSVYVARMLNNGWQTPVRLTLSGSLRRKDNIAAKIASQMMVDSATVRHAFSDTALLAGFGATPATVYSLLMPDTYEIYWDASVKDILNIQKQAVDAFWTEDRLQKAAALGLSRDEVSTLASIVNGETNNEAEMPRIAGVYLNRLKIGMPLQADPTIAFCFNYTLTRVLNTHLKVDSKYNTYRHKGLPPGPICVPTRSSLDAVLNPDFGGEWGRGNLYFCANPDFSGTHVFARTLQEHNRNAARFRAELDRRSRAK